MRMRKFTVGTVKKSGLRLEEEQARPPASPQAGKPHPEDPISLTKARALEDGYLLAEGQVLCGERRAALEQLPEEDGDDLQCAYRGSRVSWLPRAYRVASLKPAVGKRKQWRKVLSI